MPPTMGVNIARLAAYLRALADDMEQGLPPVRISQRYDAREMGMVLVYEVIVPDNLVAVQNVRKLYGPGA